MNSKEMILNFLGIFLICFCGASIVKQLNYGENSVAQFAFPVYSVGIFVFVASILSPINRRLKKLEEINFNRIKED